RDTFSGAHFATLVALFGTPVAVSSVTMAQEMNGDTVLAGQLVVWTTVVSMFTIFLCAFLLKTAGIF
ncbi:MAG: AEC family transporter, partial [Clostridia bacterium]|nr:AEC family transporter [Clostridia bacterium]